MSRIAKTPVNIPSGVEVNVEGQTITVKGPKGQLVRTINDEVTVVVANNEVNFNWATRERGVSSAQAGTARSLVNSMVIGVSEGFERKLKLIGTGFRAAVQGNKLQMALGFSHPIEYQLPQGVTAQCPSQTDIVLQSIDKYLLGQTAANIRAFRKPEPYKGKGVRYADEVVITKEVKKK